MSGLNTGTPVRITLQVTGEVQDDTGDSLFGPKDFGIDWSLYDFESSGTYLIKPTDNQTVLTVSGSSTIEVVLIKTTAPIDVNFTQDTVSKTVRVRPLVKPINFFTSKASPSQAPTAFGHGIYILTGGNITSLALAGVGADAQSAKVIVAVVGYNVAP